MVHQVQRLRTFVFRQARYSWFSDAPQCKEVVGLMIHGVEETTALL